MWRHFVLDFCFLLALRAYAVAEDSNDNYAKCDFTQNLHQDTTKWLLESRDTEWGWGKMTIRAVLALQMTDMNWLNEEDLSSQLSVKEMNIHILSDFLQREPQNILAGELAFMINSLVFSCQDPRDFHGVNLIENLSSWMSVFPIEDFNNGFQYGLAVLALCNANEPISDEYIAVLTHDLQNADGTFLFGADEASMVLMALSCVRDRGLANADVSEAVESIVFYLIGKQQEDGSFGNEHTTALVLQALISADIYRTNWNCNAALEALKHFRLRDGSFGRLGTPLFTSIEVLPSLRGKTYTHNSTACPQKNTVTVIQSSRKISVRYSLEDSVTNRFSMSRLLRVSENSTMYQVMSHAASVDENFQFETKNSSFGRYVSEINGLKSNFMDQNYWFLLIGKIGEQLSMAVTGIDTLILSDGDHVMFRYQKWESS